MKAIFGYGILLCLVCGALTFLGYIAAICIGGDMAVRICAFLYEEAIPVMIYTATVLVLFGLLIMYLSGEQALTVKKK